MSGAAGYDVGDLILRGVGKYIPSRKDSVYKKAYREDRETFAMVKSVNKDEISADVTLGLDISEVEGNLFKNIPIKLELGEGNNTGNPHGRIRYPQEGDIVSIKFFHNRLQRYIDRVVFFRAGNYKNKNIKDKIISLVDSIKDWLDYHISGTWYKTKENGDFEAKFKSELSIKTEDKKVTVELEDEYKLTISDTDGLKIDIKSGNTTVEITKDKIEAVRGSTSVVVKGDAVEVGGGSMKKLITETFINLHNAHTHPTAAPGPPSTPTVPIVPSAVTTLKTVAS